MKRRTCSDCPLYDPKGRWCKSYAAWTNPGSPSCDYGRKLLQNAYAREWQRRRLGITPDRQRPERAPKMKEQRK